MDKVIHALNVLNMTDAFKAKNFYAITVTPNELCLQGNYSHRLVRELDLQFNTNDVGYLEAVLYVDGVKVDITLT